MPHARPDPTPPASAPVRPTPTPAPSPAPAPPASASAPSASAQPPAPTSAPSPAPASPASALAPPTPPPTAVRLPIAVDVVALTVADGALRVLLVDRLLEPYAGRPALPGGFLLDGEDVAGAAVRELTEETGVAPRGHLEQLRTYGPVGRDPRGPVLSVAHLLFSPVLDLPRAGGDAAAVRWAPVAPFLEGDAHLAFDHDRILADGVERARAKIEYSSLATVFCPEEFTIAELRRVYEAVWGTRLDPRNFHRKATRSEGFLQATGRARSEGAGRPAALFRRPPGSGPTAAVLQPPLLRPVSAGRPGPSRRR